MFFRWLLAIMAIFLHFTFYGQEKQAFVMFSDMAEDDIMAALNQIEEASK